VFIMKKATKSKLVLRREFVKTLATVLQDDRLRDVRGGSVWNSFMSDLACSEKCSSTDQ